MGTMINGREFTCPECGRHDLDEVSTDVTVTDYVERITVDEEGDHDVETAGKPDMDCGGEVFLRCEYCNRQFTGDDLWASAPGKALDEEAE
jgi:predicted RNA-binding Zn-ribbon protein involved in translation (DUF1610 family)